MDTEQWNVLFGLFILSSLPFIHSFTHSFVHPTNAYLKHTLSQALEQSSGDRSIPAFEVEGGGRGRAKVRRPTNH